MKLRVVAVGRLRDAGLRRLCDEYVRRVQRHCALAELEVRDDRALLKALDASDFNVALEVEGRALNSRQLAAQFEHWGQQAPRVSLFIGAADGLPAALSQRTQAALSLSRLTLPHRIARLLLFEQLYRCTAIWRGEPYAKED